MYTPLNQRLLTLIKTTLSDCENLKNHRVQILTQDQGNIASEVARVAAQLDGIAIVIALDKITPNPPWYTIDFSLIITEMPELNRQYANALSALDTAEIAANALSQPIYNLRDITHLISDDGIFQATANFSITIDNS